jgi:hypothetical protein
MPSAAGPHPERDPRPNGAPHLPAHRNPVKRGLVEKPEDWKWSSFRHYATAETGPVEMESQWTADRRRGRSPKLMDIREG